jgi:cytosine/adenosine deaminase-related metal-dependent hydrolase
MISIAPKRGLLIALSLALIGVVAAGKRADLMVVRGDPSTTIADIEQVETVFKAGIGYDSAKLFASVRGQVGLH